MAYDNLSRVTENDVLSPAPRRNKEEASSKEKTRAGKKRVEHSRLRLIQIPVNSYTAYYNNTDLRSIFRL